MRRLDFIGNLDEEPPFDYLREKAPFWEEVGGLFFVYVQNYYMLEVGLAGVSCYGSCSTLRAGHLDQFIFLVWPVKCQNIIEVVLVERTWLVSGLATVILYCL